MSYITWYKAWTVTNLWTNVNVTTTISTYGSPIDTTGYSYIKFFANATMTTNSKQIFFYTSSAHTTSWTLYQHSQNFNADVISASTAPSGWDGIYVSSIGSVTSKASGTDYVVKSSHIINIVWTKQLQLYAAHNDTWNIATTIDYVLFNL